MRLLVQICAALTLLAASGGCKRNKEVAPMTPEPAPVRQLASVINMGDEKASSQLVNGFHAIEQGAWRWSMKTFAVTLPIPSGASATGATLSLRFAAPEVVVQKLGKITLAAKLNGTALAAQVISRPGDGEYRQAVPATALAGETVTVEFALDKALAPGTVDSRELGLVISQVSLEAK